MWKLLTQIIRWRRASPSPPPRPEWETKALQGRATDSLDALCQGDPALREKLESARRLQLAGGSGSRQSQAGEPGAYATGVTR